MHACMEKLFLVRTFVRFVRGLCALKGLCAFSLVCFVFGFVRLCALARVEAGTENPKHTLIEAFSIRTVLQ